jgi:hypothetical protein
MLAAAMPDADLPQWLDKIDVDTVAVFTLDDGERLTADVFEFNDDRSELIVDVVPSHRPYPDSDQRRRAIPLSRVVSCEPLSRAEQPWPFSDPCRRVHFALARFVVMAALFLCMTVGSLPLFVVLTDRPYGIQGASAIAYTLFAVFFTFGAWRRFRPYRFTCPAVWTQVPSLLWRHLGFLVALFALQSVALAVRPNLPDWWNTASGHGRRGDMPPFVFTLMLLCLGLGYAQVFTNRSLIDRAHREFKT